MYNVFMNFIYMGELVAKVFFKKNIFLMQDTVRLISAIILLKVKVIKVQDRTL